MTEVNSDGRAIGRASAAVRRLARAVAFARYVLARFNRDGCFAASGALSYTTLVSLVPLGVIAFSILSIFPKFNALRQQFLSELFHDFVPAIGDEAAWWFDFFANSAAQATAMGILGIAATGVLLLVTVEDQLNLIWRVSVPRPWGQRILAYWTLMTLGPLLIGSSLTLSTYFELAARHAGFDTTTIVDLATSWWQRAERLLPIACEFIACTLLYCVIPNCAVRWRDGVVGGLAAAGAIQALKNGFSFYVTVMVSYQTVYGALAAIPIFLLWMYLSWMVVLLGAVIAANLPTWQIDERLGQLGIGGVRLAFSLALIATLARAQRQGRTYRTVRLAAELGIATTVLVEHLNRLVRTGFVTATQAGDWALGWNPENATLHDLYTALDLPLARSWTAEERAPWQTLVAPAMRRIVNAETAAMQLPLARLLAEIDSPGAPPVRAIAEGGRSE
jgi:membrane protein